MLLEGKAMKLYRKVKKDLSCQTIRYPSSGSLEKGDANALRTITAPLG